MTPEHVIFIPGVLLVGLALGYAMGAKAARKEMEGRATACASRRPGPAWARVPLDSAGSARGRFPRAPEWQRRSTSVVVGAYGPARPIFPNGIYRN